MDPITLGLAVAGGGNLIGSLIGAITGASGRGEAMELIKKGIADMEKIGIPPVEAQKLLLQEFRSAGRLTPELEEVFQQADSELKGIQTDPRLKEAQLNALGELERLGEGGMNLSDLSSLNKVQDELAASERGSREAILADTRARGQMGSGLEVAALLQNQQASADRASNSGLDIAAQAQQRALEAIMAGGELGGQIRGQDFEEQARIAAAQDAINAFNTRNRQSVSGANVDRTNDATRFNLTNDQRIMDSNTELANKQQIHNKDLYQQQYQNQMNKQTAINNARTGQATALNQNADRTSAMWTGIGQGVGQLATGAAKEAKDAQRWDDYLKLQRQKMGITNG